MPCYDPRDTSPAADLSRERIRLINEFQHNSNVAQLLCSVMKAITPEDRIKLGVHIPGLAVWWTAHQQRDALKEQKEKNEARSV